MSPGSSESAGVRRQIRRARELVLRKGELWPFARSSSGEWDVGGEHFIVGMVRGRLVAHQTQESSPVTPTVSPPRDLNRITCWRLIRGSRRPPFRQRAVVFFLG
jgi:hypothetical protein